MPRVKCTSLNADRGPHADIFRQAGFEFGDVNRERDLFVAENLIDELSDCDAVVAGSEPYPAHVIESLPKLRVIARSGVGYDAVDLDACDRTGVVVTVTPGVNHHAVAEHAISLLMGVARGFPRLDRQVRDNDWHRVARPRVMGTTLGIMGLGRIGRAVTTRAVGLGMNVLAYEPYPQQEFVEQWRVELVELDDLLARSDYVSLHLPVSAETRHIMNAAAFAKMKSGSVLINTARGMLVDEAALCAAIESGHLRAAGLDVFEVEPLPLTSPLFELDNVLLSGHIAGLDNESQQGTFRMVAETTVALFRGDWPAECIVNLRGVTDWHWDRA